MGRDQGQARGDAMGLRAWARSKPGNQAGRTDRVVVVLCRWRRQFMVLGAGGAGFWGGRVHTGHILTTYPDSLPTPHPSVTSERIHSTTHTHPRQPIRTLPHTSIPHFVFVFRWTA